ncbi:Rha family transcriptional regulator [Methylomagnum ishizawai]|uniref:Rha family transcriptional regulator n=1 Tax=Methylomagnum ishizawai TaxID=1760988 RepID=UPI001C32588D|nr:Rha family transcriptional regulator [Methylomagnum ishizawai]BBL75455.1 hypothetical protein MishRS11D_25530 [Methylomagnum ishizawai]
MNDLIHTQNPSITMSSVDISELVESRHDKVKQSIERLAERGVISPPPLGEVKVQRERRTSNAIVSIVGGVPKTTSLIVAETFEKSHAHVLRDIDNLECSPGFRESNFGLTFRDVPGPNNSIRRERMYEMTRDGFTILAMGFTGKSAMEWKEKYIEAFNRLELLAQQPATPSPASSTRISLEIDGDRLTFEGDPRSRTAFHFNDLVIKRLMPDGAKLTPLGEVPKSPQSEEVSPRTAAPKPSQDAGELILYFIGQGGPEGRTPKDLAQRCWAFKKLSPDVRESVMASLLDRGEIVQVPRGRGGRAYIRVEGSTGLDVSASPVKATPGMASGLRVDGRGESP